MTAAAKTLKQVFTFRWNPGKDLAIVAATWILVVVALYLANVIIGPAVWGGIAYFLL